MKKIIIAAKAVLMMTSFSASADDNKTGWFNDMKSATVIFVTDTKRKYDETNKTAVWEVAKKSVSEKAVKTKVAVIAGVKAVEESWNKDSESGYTEALNEVWEMENVPVEELNKEEVVKIITYYELQFNNTDDKKYKKALKNRLEILKNKQK